MSTPIPITERPLGVSAYLHTALKGVPGRRFRTFAQLVSAHSGVLWWGQTKLVMGLASTPTLGEAFKMLEGNPALAHLPLRQKQTAMPLLHDIADLAEGRMANPELVDALQDLAEEVFVDLDEACLAFANPTLYYPGVDEGIAPVPDEHVKLVIAAVQRELVREQGRMSAKAPVLAHLPWYVQRSFVERRRLRFAQYGIGHEEWLRGEWSLWRVAEDADWVPRAQRN